jgi:hypothetical protein
LGRQKASFVRRGDLMHEARDQSFRYRKDLGLPNQVCLFRRQLYIVVASGPQATALSRLSLAAVAAAIPPFAQLARCPLVAHKAGDRGLQQMVALASASNKILESTSGAPSQHSVVQHEPPRTSFRKLVGLCSQASFQAPAQRRCALAQVTESASPGNCCGDIPPAPSSPDRLPPRKFPASASVPGSRYSWAIRRSTKRSPPARSGRTEPQDRWRQGSRRVAHSTVSE